MSTSKKTFENNEEPSNKCLKIAGSGEQKWSLSSGSRSQDKDVRWWPRRKLPKPRTRRLKRKGSKYSAARGKSKFCRRNFVSASASVTKGNQIVRTMKKRYMADVLKATEECRETIRKHGRCNTLMHYVQSKFQRGHGGRKFRFKHV